MGRHFTINSLRYDGSVKRSWQCKLIRESGTLLEFLGIFDHQVTHSHLGQIFKGTFSYEYYWLDRCYNVFRFHHPDGRFREYYCNINLPPVVGNDVLNYVDLDIDIVLDAAGKLSILDEDEFKANAVTYDYGEALLKRADAAISDVLALIKNREFPFNYSG